MVKLYRATGKKVKVSGDHFGNGIRSIWPLAGAIISLPGNMIHWRLCAPGLL